MPSPLTMDLPELPVGLLKDDSGSHGRPPWLERAQKMNIGSDCSGLEVAWEAFVDAVAEGGGEGLFDLCHSFSSDTEKACRRNSAEG